MNNVTNHLPQIPVDYVTNDYRGYFEMMKEAIPVFTPDWTDTSDTDQGIVILQLLSYGLHILGYYQERVMQENILELARTKKGILTGCRFLGYNPARQTASVATLKITKDTDFEWAEKVVPTGSKFSTDPKLGTPIVFETTEPLVIPAGQLSGEVYAIQGETIEGEQLGISDGKANQKFTISQADVLVDSIFIHTYENNLIRAWIKQDYFLDSTENDRHFTIDLDEEDRTIVKFGDGLFGRRPSSELPIFVTYRVGGGVQGNLAPNLIKYVYETEHDLSFIDTVTNEEFSTGGSDYEDLQKSKVRAPKHYRSRGQAVTPTDFQDIAELTEGVSKAKCVETFDSTALYLYLLGEDYEAPTEALCKLVKDKIDSNRVGNVDLRVLPCDITEFEIKLTIYVHDKFDRPTVQSAVRDSIISAFHISNFNFGDEFFAAKVIDIAFNTAGVKNVVLDNDVTVDRESHKYEILKLSNVEVGIGGI